MKYGGYAFTKTETEEQKRIRDRYHEIKDLIQYVTVNKTPAYAHTKFIATVTEEAKDLSEEDILIIADHGNLCFGGHCDKISDDSFRGSYCTD